MAVGNEDVINCREGYMNKSNIGDISKDLSGAILQVFNIGGSTGRGSSLVQKSTGSSAYLSLLPSSGGKPYSIQDNTGQDIILINPSATNTIALASKCIIAFPFNSGAIGMPNLTTAEGSVLSGAGVISGAVIYDRTLNKLKVFTGSAWETITSVVGG